MPAGGRCWGWTNRAAGGGDSGTDPAGRREFMTAASQKAGEQLGAEALDVPPGNRRKVLGDFTLNPLLGSRGRTSYRAGKHLKIKGEAGLGCMYRDKHFSLGFPRPG